MVLLFARTLLSFQPLRGFAQGCWSPGRRDLIPLRPMYTPLLCAKWAVRRWPHGSRSIGIDLAHSHRQSGKITRQQSPGGHPSHVVDRRWHPALSRGSDEPCPAPAVVERPVHRGEKVYGFAPDKARQGKSGDDIGRRLRRWLPHQPSHPSARRRATRVARHPCRLCRSKRIPQSRGPACTRRSQPCQPTAGSAMRHRTRHSTQPKGPA